MCLVSRLGKVPHDLTSNFLHVLAEARVAKLEAVDFNSQKA